MLLPSPGALLALALLAGAAEAAEPPPGPNCAVTRRVDLVADSTGQTSELCITPDEPVTFLFEAPLPPGAVMFSGERSVGFAQGDDFVTVYPRRSFLPGERVKLTVGFGDGAAPESASFWLVGNAARGVRRVEVFRHSRPAAAFKREAAEAQAEARQCQEDKTRLLAEREEPGGLMGTAWLERGGRVSWKDLQPILNPPPANELQAMQAVSYTHSSGDARPVSVAVRVKLKNPGAAPWTVAGALLVGSTGDEVELAVWQAAPIAPSGSDHVVVGAKRAPVQLGCPCTLKLWEAQGPRIVTLEGVIFPP